ncbi:MAG: YeeE/YedE family protein [bacterium]
MFHAIFVAPWPGWVAGPLIGLYVVAFFRYARRALGASSGFPAVLEVAQGRDGLDLSRPDDPLQLPFKPGDPAPRWRIWWLAGLLAAGFLCWSLGAESTGGVELPGLSLAFPGWPLWAKVAALFGGGILIGFGTRMSGGCTSGHAIFGISQRQLPSVWATLVFFAVGMAFTFLWKAFLS